MSKVPDRRVFSEQEVTEIITRATEISAAGKESAYIPGVTIEELERIAKEVGVDAAALMQAIEEQKEPRKQKSRTGFFEEFIRVVDGELSPDDFDLAIEGVSMMNGKSSGTSQIGRTLHATAWTGVSQAFVDVQSRGGRTKIKVKSNPWMQALYTLHPAFMAALITAGSMGERGMGMLGTAIGVGLMVVGAVVFNVMRKVGHRKAEETADKIKANVEELIDERLSKPTTVVSQQGSPEQHIDLRG